MTIAHYPSSDLTGYHWPLNSYKNISTSLLLSLPPTKPFHQAHKSAGHRDERGILPCVTCNEFVSFSLKDLCLVAVVVVVVVVAAAAALSGFHLSLTVLFELTEGWGKGGGGEKVSNYQIGIRVENMKYWNKQFMQKKNMIAIAKSYMGGSLRTTEDFSLAL